MKKRTLRFGRVGETGREGRREREGETERERGVKGSVSLLTKALIPLWGPALMTSSNPDDPPEAPPPKTITLGDRTSHMNLGGYDT